MSDATLFYNAIIHTMDGENPVAHGMLVRDGRIAGIGSAGDLDAPGAQRVDLGGQAVVPGFNDSHCHILNYGLTLDQVDISADAVRSIADIQRALTERAGSRPDEPWIVGRGYDQNMLREQRHPTRADIDAAVPNRPVVLYHTSGHVLTCNSRALETGGITASTPSPAGGDIERDEHGEPTGLLKESPAMLLVGHHIPRPTVEQGARAVERALASMATYGVTSASDAATGGSTIEPELEMYRRGTQPRTVRVTLMPQIFHVAPPDGGEVHSRTELDAGDDPGWLDIGPTKIFSDGALSTRTAALREPYADDPNNFGILLWEQSTLESMIDRAHRAGWHIATHALGDRAVEAVLTAYGKALGASPRADHRYRIEHCMLVDDTLAQQFKQLGIVASVQPDIFRLGDGYVGGLGLERASDSIPLARFRRYGVAMAFSSDAPVIPCDPLRVIRSAAERRAPSGEVLGQEHAVSVMDGIRYYTAGGAFATHTDRDKGVLRAGMMADFAVLSHDPARTPVEELDRLQVTMTVAGGAITYSG